MYETKSIEQLEKEFDVDVNVGLSLEEAEKRLKKNGLNKIESGKKKTKISVFINQFKDVLILILCVSAILSFFLKEYVDGTIVLVIVFFNAIVGTIQEIKAEEALEKIKNLASPMCLVKREGKTCIIPSSNLVCGDIVVLEEGSKIPADIRFIKTHSIKVEEASLTGESFLIEKNSVELNEQKPLAERINMGFMSTTVMGGRGEGIVVKTGMETEIGKIAFLIKKSKQEETPLQKRLADLGKLLGILVVGICLVILFISIIQKRNFFEMIITSISLAVAAVPEGLPAAVTIVLAIGVQRMAKVNTIVRRLPSVETLGAVSIICSDKTGTLTQNKLSVIKKWSSNIDETLLFEAMTLCNNASIENEALGDPTEIALLEYAKRNKFIKKELDVKYIREDEAPFDSKRKRMSVLCKYDKQKKLYVKGAIEGILSICDFILKDNKVVSLTQTEKEQILNLSKEFSLEALRILSFAYRENVNNCDESHLVFLGFVGMKDTPRIGVKESIAKLKKAGITTIMITGDNIDTAYAVAKEIGIASKKEECLKGLELDLLDEKELREIVKNIRVFARVTPEHKMRIVKAFKENNHIVAMTGDGVNDAPSLKTADIGIAMGISGTDVAKESSDMILVDDNFSSIEKAVEEGRGIYANIKKTVIFLLSSNIGEVFTMLVAILLRFPLPLMAIHILWVNLITDTLPALALGADPKDNNIMNEKPRPLKESLFANGGLKTVFFYGVFITLLTIGAFVIYPLTLAMKQGNVDIISSLCKIKEIFTNGINGLSGQYILSKSQTYAFTALGFSQLFHMLGMSNTKQSVFKTLKNKNKLMFLAFGIGFILQFIVVEFIPISNFFMTTSLSLKEWAWLVLISSLPLFAHELFVIFKRN